MHTGVPVQALARMLLLFRRATGRLCHCSNDLCGIGAGTFSFAGYEALGQDDHRKFEQAFTTKVRLLGEGMLSQRRGCKASA